MQELLERTRRLESDLAEVTQERDVVASQLAEVLNEMENPGQQKSSASPSANGSNLAGGSPDLRPASAMPASPSSPMSNAPPAGEANLLSPGSTQEGSPRIMCPGDAMLNDWTKRPRTMQVTHDSHHKYV